MTYRVGQKIVCIKENPHNHWPDCPPPRLNRVYTIRAMREGTHGHGLELHLREIVNAKRRAAEEFGEPYYHHSRFRPAVDKKTDISIFTEILVDKRESIDA